MGALVGTAVLVLILIAIAGGFDGGGGSSDSDSDSSSLSDGAAHPTGTTTICVMLARSMARLGTECLAQVEKHPRQDVYG